MRVKLSLLFSIIGIVITFTFQYPAIAAITGPCANCHTMHNSQNGTHMIEYLGPGESDTNPKEALLRGTCIGCHAMDTGGPSIGNIGGTQVPQVYHSGTDLAGGNFAYMMSDDSKGHNVVDFGNPDDVLDGPPGPINQNFHDQIVLDTNLTCVGENGCHGKRYYLIPPDFNVTLKGIAALKGAHHSNIDGKCDNPTDVFDSYRFLMGVKGLENTVSKWQNVGPADHNEYFGATSPLILGCGGGEIDCHGSQGDISPPNGSISVYCGTCHGLFHTLTGPGMADWEGIGRTTSSPFKRHPTDVALPGGSTEYADYTTYSIVAPIARTGSVPDAPSPTVNPGTTDVVMCLSCHGSHATNYPDLLRWDYSDMIAGDTSKSGGFFPCHTQKND